jgi:hypothetical protein
MNRSQVETCLNAYRAQQSASALPARFVRAEHIQALPVMTQGQALRQWLRDKWAMLLLIVFTFSVVVSFALSFAGSLIYSVPSWVLVSVFLAATAVAAHMALGE